MKKENNNYSWIHVALILFFMFTFQVIPLFFYIVGLVTYKLTKRAIRKKNTKHKKFNIQYFRDDLKKMSPSYISYILDFSIELDKDVAAHVLKLYIDKFIKYEDNRFTVTNKNTDNLKPSDKCLLEFVENNFHDKTFLNRYQQMIKTELCKDGYITEFLSKKDIFSIFSGLATCIIGFFFTSSFGVITGIKSDFLVVIQVILDVIFFLGIVFFPAILVAKIIAYVKFGLGKRTEKGEKLLEEIYGLKNFLKDFSIMKERKLEDVYLQEHYLVYALTLGVNNKVDDEIIKKINKQMKINY